MCKLYIAVGSFTKSQALKLIDEVCEIFGTSQKDGFGFVAYGGGKVCTAKHLNPDSYVGFGHDVPPFIAGERIETGKMPAIVTALVIHGRTSTNKVCIDNVHPFTSGRLRLAHNGVLSWAGEGDGPSAKHDCDSEEFLNWFTSFKTPEEAWAATKANWTGYGVFGLIDSARRTLTVAKCGAGRLSWARCANGHLFSTDGSDVVNAARRAGIKCTRSAIVSSGTVSVFKIGGDEAELASVKNWDGFGSFSTVGNTSYARSGYTGTTYIAATCQPRAAEDWSGYNSRLPRNTVGVGAKTPVSVTADSLTEEELAELVEEMADQREARARERVEGLKFPDWEGRGSD